MSSYCSSLIVCQGWQAKTERERIFDAGWQEIYSRQRKSKSGPGEIWKWLQRNIIWRAEEIQVWRELWLALIFVCRVFKYRYRKNHAKEKRVYYHKVISFYEIKVSEVPKSDDDAVKAKPHPLQVTMWLNQCNGSQRRTGGRGHSLRPNSPGLSDKSNTAAT